MVFTSPPVKLGFGLSCEYARTQPDSKMASFNFRLIRSASQIFVEKIERARPSQLGGRFVVAWRSVVMEAVIRSLVNVRRVGDVVGFQSFLIGWPAVIDALVQSPVLQQQRRFNFCDVGRHRLRAVEWN